MDLDPSIKDMVAELKDRTYDASVDYRHKMEILDCIKDAVDFHTHNMEFGRFLKWSDKLKELYNYGK